jgi:hypothetical protein
MTPLGRTQKYYGKELELFKLEVPPAKEIDFIPILLA